MQEGEEFNERKNSNDPRYAATKKGTGSARYRF